MGKKKTKVANRRKARQQTPSRRRSADGGSGGGSGGGALGGLRGGFRSLTGTGRTGKERSAGSNFWSIATWVILAGAVAVLVGRYAC